jgi:hypothetical protein
MAPKAQTKGRPRRLTPAQEKFVQAYALQRNASEAYRQAYPGSRKWKPEHVHQEACKLLKHPRVAPRVEELETIAREKANAAFAMRAEDVIARLTLLATGTLRDFLQLDEQGQPTISLKTATDAQLYVLNEVTVEDIVAGPRQGKRTKIKLGDRIAALRLLGQHHQLFGERITHEHQHVHLIESAAAELTQKIALLTSRAREPSATVAEAEVVPVPMVADEREQQAAA